MRESMSDKARTLLATLGLAAGAYWGYDVIFSKPVEAQTDSYLARRVDAIENRFYGIESRLNRIEQTSISSSAPAPRLGDLNSVELAALRTQIDSFRLRLGEVECALLRLDERTLPAASRRNRPANALGSDRCRQDWGSPVKLSARPE